MATTSIWSVKGWLGKVVIYVENPEKTTAPEIAKLPEYKKEEAVQTEEKMQSLSDVIAYAVNEEKTDQKEEKVRRRLSVRRSRLCSSMFPVLTVRPPPPAVK